MIHVHEKTSPQNSVQADYFGLGIYHVSQKLDEAIRTYLDMYTALDALTKNYSKQIKTTTNPEDIKFLLLKNFDYSCYAIHKIYTLDRSSEEYDIMEQTVTAQAYYYLWCICQEMETFFKKFPPQTDWFLAAFKNLDTESSCALIMLETLSKVWGPTEFAIIKKEFETFYEEQQHARRKKIEKSHPEGYIKSERWGLPVSTDMATDIASAYLANNSQKQLSRILDLLILFQGDVKTFLSTQFKEAPPTIEELTSLGEYLLNHGLLKSAQTCLESIPTPKLCKEHQGWHEVYNFVLRFTGQHKKALALRWEYFQTVKTSDGAYFYINPLQEQFSPFFIEDKADAKALYDEHITKVKQAIILDFPLEEAVDLSLELWCESSSYDDLLDDLMLHYYDHNKLSSCPTYLLQNLLDKIKNDLDGSEGENAPMLLAALMAYRTLIQRKWWNKDQMSAQKSQELRSLIDQAQKVDTKLTRTTTTQHIPSHQEFINHLKTKHSQEVTPPHQPSSPRPTL